MVERLSVKRQVKILATHLVPSCKAVGGRLEKESYDWLRESWDATYPERRRA